MRTNGKLFDSDDLNKLLAGLLTTGNDARLDLIMDKLGEHADYCLLNETSRDDAEPSDFVDEGVRLSALASDRAVAVVKVEHEEQVFYFARLRAHVERFLRDLDVNPAADPVWLVLT